MKDFVLGAIIGIIVGATVSYAGLNYQQHTTERTGK